MISKKIQNAGLINLEDDSKEITIVIQEFNTIGIEYLEQKYLISIHLTNIY